MAIVAMNPVVSYEDVRKQRMEENNRKMEALGLVGLSASVKKNAPVKRPLHSRRIPVEGEFALEARRSSRLGGKAAVSYSDQVDLMWGMRMRVGTRERQPLPRRYLSDAARMAAVDLAEEVYKDVKNPAFVKPMLHSHTASGFWLGLPANFCKEYLPHRDEKVTLEDEETLEWECVYLAHKVGLSGGWRGFSLDHELVDGDCCIFELVEQRRFKVHIFRCEEQYEGDEQADVTGSGADVAGRDAVTEKKKPLKYNKKTPSSAPGKVTNGRKLSTSTRKLDLEDRKEIGKEGNVESPKASKKVKKEVNKDVAGPSRSSKRRRVKEEDDDIEAGVALQSGQKEVKSKKQKEKDCGQDVVELGSSEDDGDVDFQKPAAQSEVIQTGIRAFGRITRNSLAKSLPKKS